MKTLSILALTFIFGGGYLFSKFTNETPETGIAVDEKRSFQIEELNEIREEQKRSYLSFLNKSSLHCGVYHLKKDSKDTQSPHAEDEVYFVQSGKAKLWIEGKDYECKPGGILFVAAKEKHYFHKIEEDLTLLVFFSKAKPETEK